MLSVSERVGLESKIRYLSLTSLAEELGSSNTISSTNSSSASFTNTATAVGVVAIPYDKISSVLDVPLDDVEMWVIDTIRSGLIDAKMDQLKKVAIVRFVHNFITRFIFIV